MNDDLLRRKVEKRKKSENRPDPEDPALRNHHCHSATLLFCHSAASVTAALAVMLALATLAPPVKLEHPAV